MRTAFTHFIAIAALAFFTSVLQANETQQEDEDTGATFAEKVEACAACHGQDGDKPLLPEYPILAGQYKGYLANALRQYRDGRRTNAIMKLQLEILELTDTDIEQLAAYFAAKPSPLHGLAD
jgi:cytochrome c553